MKTINTAIFPITDTCNLNCNFCFASAKMTNKSKMDEKFFEEQICYLKKFGLKQVILTGGEPCLHPRILSFLKLTEKYSLKTQLLTNGTTSNFLNVCKYVDHIVISIDGKHDTHDYLRGKKGALKITVDALKLLSSSSTPFSITMTVSENNYKEIEYVYLLAMQLGAESIKINPVVNEGRATKIDISNSIYTNIYHEIKTVYKKYSFRLPVYTSLSTRKKTIENIESLVFGLYSSVWIGENNSFSYFPLPNDDSHIYTFQHIDPDERNFCNYLQKSFIYNNFDEVIDQHKYLKEKYIKYLLEVKNV